MIKDDFINYKYNQKKVLGKGGFCKVVLAENKITKEKVAIKYIKFEDKDEYDKNKIVQEGQILFKFIHQNIIKFEEFSYNNSRAILIMEFAEGGDLSKRINEQKKIGPFKEEIIITWFLELCNVVKYCHERHTLHRDLKPLNIFLTKDDHIKLGDFGISKILNSTKDYAHTQIGSCYYMSPEVIKGERYSYSSDIWSLGIILNELCLLENPLSHIEYRSELYNYIMNNDVAKIDQNCENNYSAETCNLIKKILVKNPNERPSIDQIIEECEDILLDLKCIKAYFNNSVYKLTFYGNTEIEFTKKLYGNFGGKIPDGKYIIEINNEKKMFHIIDGNKIFDCTKKIQKLRRDSGDNLQKKLKNNEIQKQNDVNLFILGVDEPLNKNAVEDELRKTMSIITHTDFNIINEGKKRVKPWEIKNNQMISLQNNNEGNYKNKINPNRNFRQNGQQKGMINKRLKSTPKVINDRCSNIINQENNKVEELVNNNNCNGNECIKYKSKEHFSNNFPASNSDSRKTQKDSEEEESYNNFKFLKARNYNEENEIKFYT